MKLKKILFISTILALLTGVPEPLCAKHHSSDSSESCSNRCTAPKGYVYRGYGPNLTTSGNVFFKGAMYDNDGCQVGTVSASSSSESGPITNTFSLNDGGKLEIVLTQDSTISSAFPIDALAVACFPEVAPYLGNPNAALLINSCNHTKHNDPNVLAWSAKGSLKHSNYLEVRCVFLLLNGEISKQLGCHWFIGKTK